MPPFSYTYLGVGTYLLFLTLTLVLALTLLFIHLPWCWHIPPFSYTYPCIGTRLPFAVLPLCHPFVEFDPHSLSLPWRELTTEAAVEQAVIGVLEFERLAQLMEGTQDSLTSPRLQEGIEDVVRGDVSVGPHHSHIPPLSPNHNCPVLYLQ